MMTIPEILRELEPYIGRFPMDAMRSAVEQREGITPELLRVMEAVADDPVKHAERKDYMLPLFALHLLAQFREKRAYAPIIKMFSSPGETPFDLFGDTVTERLSRILASVYDGNPAPLRGLVESDEVNEYVRSAALDTFLVLEHTGQMPHAEVVEYFRSLFHEKLQRTHSYAWDGFVCAVADLEGIERDMAAPKPWRRDRQRLITDAKAEMEWWSSFHPEASWPKKRSKVETPMLPPEPAAPSPSSYVAPKPVVREPKIGRNDPCPCGSGKKYKKCCGKG